MADMTSYLLVRDFDGAILAEFDSPRAGLKLLLRNPDLRAPGVSLVRLHDTGGECVGTSSMVTVHVANFGTQPPVARGSRSPAPVTSVARRRPR
jgi:hypothetical protein